MMAVSNFQLLLFIKKVIQVNDFLSRAGYITSPTSKSGIAGRAGIAGIMSIDFRFPFQNSSI